LQGIELELIEGAFLYDLSGDFSKPEEQKRMMDEIARNCGHVDALVCNHALSGRDGAIGDLTAEMLEKDRVINKSSSIIQEELFAAQYDSKIGRGKIIFMTSGQRLGPMPGEIAYAASKGALADITMSISDQLADDNITVNTINPGPVDTGYL